MNTRTFEQTFPRLSTRVAALSVVVLAAWLQSIHALQTLGVNPHLVLVALIACAVFEKNPWFFAVLVLIAFFILFPAPLAFREALAFGSAAFSGLGLLIMFKERFLISTFLMVIAIASALFYLILDPNFLLGATQVFIFEVLLNCLWGTVFAAYVKFMDFSLEYR